MHFLEPPALGSGSQGRSSSQTNFIIEEDSRSDISSGDFPPGNGGGSGGSGESNKICCTPYFWCPQFLCHRLILGGLCIAIILMTAAATVFGYLYVRTIPTFQTCKSRQCTRTATLFMKTMDESVNPCDDFYRFACGNWISDTAAVVSVAVYDHTTIMRDRIVGRLRSLTENITNEDIEALQQMRILYNTCVNLAAIEDAGLEPLVNLVTRLISPKDSVAKMLATIYRETGQNYLFDMSIGPSFQNTSVNLISIDQPELPVVQANFLYSPDMIKAYETLIRKVFQRLSMEPGFPKIGDITKAAERVTAFERLFALSMSDEDDQGKAASSTLFSLKDLNVIFQNENGTLANATSKPDPANNSSLRHTFNWTEYTETLFKGVPGVKITDDFLINVASVPYIQKIAGILYETNPEHLKLYLMWELLYTFGKDVTKEVRDLFNAFTTITQGTEKSVNRHTECVLLLDQSLPFALTYKYIKKYVNESTIQEAREMFLNVLRAFKSQVIHIDWMDVGTKRRALEKANMIEAYIGFPKWLTNGTAVNVYYQGLRFTNNSFFKNILSMMKWISMKSLREYPDPVDRTWVSDSPAEADAFYDDERNAITFPAGFLQEPFIGMGLKAIDYGALGSVMGHELTHGFDTMGRYSDEYGRLNSWWTLDTLQQFVRKAECFEKQYGAYWLPELSPVPGPNNTVNGKRTLAENIADNGGVREAFHAYQYYVGANGIEPRLPGLERYSPNQIFFLSFAQSWCSYLSPAALMDLVETNVHSPPKFRIQGPLSNFPEFSNVWNCPAGSRMNPGKKCVLWG